MTMARTLLLIALCVLPALVSAARPNRTPYLVEGRVFCDTCQAGFETRATTYIAGAKVKVECKDRKSMQVVYSREGETNSEGKYKILVSEDHKDQLCDAVLISSPQSDCNTVAPGRERSRVILTSYNGNSHNGFQKPCPCPAVLRFSGYIKARRMCRERQGLWHRLFLCLTFD